MMVLILDYYLYLVIFKFEFFVELFRVIGDLIII